MNDVEKHTAQRKEDVAVNDAAQAVTKILLPFSTESKKRIVGGSMAIFGWSVTLMPFVGSDYTEG